MLELNAVDDSTQGEKKAKAKDPSERYTDPCRRQVYVAKEAFVNRLRSIGKWNPVMNHLIPKRYHTRTAPYLSFLCLHNKCGKLYERDCDDLINCCHHIFSVESKGKYFNRGFMRCYFCSVPKSPDETGLPTLQFNWMRHANTKEMENLPLQNGIQGWIRGTLKKGHMYK